MQAYACVCGPARVWRNHRRSIRYETGNTVQNRPAGIRESHDHADIYIDHNSSRSVNHSTRTHLTGYSPNNTTFMSLLLWISSLLWLETFKRATIKTKTQESEPSSGSIRHLSAVCDQSTAAARSNRYNVSTRRYKVADPRQCEVLQCITDVPSGRALLPQSALDTPQ